MVRALLDSNILIDFLRRHEQAVQELRRYKAAAISQITWIEVLVGVEAEKMEATRRFLTRFAVLPIDREVAEAAVEVRRTLRLKLADALILATARRYERLLVSRDVKAFDIGDPGVRIPYRL